MTQFINDFDLVFKNLFDHQSRFQPVAGNKMNYPVDIFLKDDLLHFCGHSPMDTWYHDSSQ